jgi:DNA-binding NarL/FixJ family response regulator
VKNWRKLCQHHPECKVIIISSQDKKWNIFKSLEFNVYCYLTKECSIQDIFNGDTIWLHRARNSFAVLLQRSFWEKKFNPCQIKTTLPNCLTERETDIVRMISKGRLNKEIAHELGLSPHTIHAHRKNIMKKLGVHSAVELANYAKEMGIIA